MAYNFEKALQSDLKPQEITDYLSSQGREKEAEQYFQRQDTGFFEGIKQDVMKRATNLLPGVDAYQKGEQGLASTVLQTAGQGAGLGLDIAGRAISAITPDVVEKPVMGAIGSVAGAVAKTQPVQDVAKAYDAWKKQHPEAARNLEATANIASFLPIGVGVIRGAKAVPGVVSSAVKKLPSIIPPGGSSAVSKVASTVSGAGQYAKSRIPKALSIFTGESDDAVRSALANPKVADIGIQKGDEALRQAVQKAGEQSIKIKDNFIRAHAQAFRQLAGSNVKNLVSKKEVQNAFLSSLPKDVRIGQKGGLDFSTSKVIANPGEVGKIQTAYNAINKWDDFSLEGVNRLKQLVGSLTRFADESGIPSKSPVLGKYYGVLNEQIVNKLPKISREKYIAMNKKFTDTIDLMDDMVYAFNSGNPFTRVANIFSKNNDTMRQIVEFYEKRSRNKISPIVAGRELGMEKAAAFGFLNPRSWIDMLISPQAQAKVVTKVGEFMQK